MAEYVLYNRSIVFYRSTVLASLSCNYKGDVLDEMAGVLAREGRTHLIMVPSTI